MTLRAIISMAAAASFVASAGDASAQPSNCYSSSHSTCEDGPEHPLPSSVKEFLELREKIGKDPWGGATLFQYGWMVSSKDEELGKKMMLLATFEYHLVKSGSGGGIYKGYDFGRGFKFHLNMFDKYSWCATAYAVGATPENGYALPKKVKVRFRKQERLVGSIDSGRYKVFACSSGTATCRPMRMKRNKKGYWKVDSISSLSTGCSKPKSNEPTAADEL